jgi:predicted nucleic acid-binding protein
MALDLPNGARCFVDANIFYYAFTEDPSFSGSCQRFLERVETGELLAHTTLQTLADAVHKTMLVEAAARSGQQRPGLIGWLNKHPEVLGLLRITRDVGRQILGSKDNRPGDGLRVTAPSA